ncbi:metalloregulator ArsR/SmtB family transcription factor [Nocardia sp. NBC_00881]|uniref:ArsR/SmtB family transcription factor n=1 Tax=Nocardia sp. NBC_00881 TaxID=2975995 RepID=UPI0038650963|nr:metalloregulator ArsR/SmtB family transcription factor [Nocardia sp. NBC_00881]
MTKHGEPPGLIPADRLQDAAAVFGMLAATARLQILWLLSQDERDVGTLAAAIGQTVPAVSQHLAKLKLAGLVRAHKDGRRNVYAIADPDVADIVRLAFRHQRGAIAGPSE